MGGAVTVVVVAAAAATGAVDGRLAHRLSRGGSGRLDSGGARSTSSTPARAARRPHIPAPLPPLRNGAAGQAPRARCGAPAALIRCRPALPLEGVAGGRPAAYSRQFRAPRAPLRAAAGTPFPGRGPRRRHGQRARTAAPSAGVGSITTRARLSRRNERRACAATPAAWPRVPPVCSAIVRSCLTSIFAKKMSPSKLSAVLTTRNRTKDTLISENTIYSQMLCQLSYGEPEGMTQMLNV
jgi:hypothetical protein